jgi:hypothetical protein
MPRYDVLVCYPVWASRITEIEAPDPARAAEWAMDEASVARDWKTGEAGESHVESIWTVDAAGDPDKACPIPPCFRDTMEGDLADSLRFVVSALEAINPSLEAVKAGRAALADYSARMRREPVITPGGRP